MRLILDTHIVLAVLGMRLSRLSPAAADLIAKPDVQSGASVASLWEIAIKTRLGKLIPGMPLDLIPKALDAAGIGIIPITAAHALAEVEPIPPTRDPFDRLLLAQCDVEGRLLVTLDHALTGHPLAARLDGTSAPTRENPRTRR